MQFVPITLKALKRKETDFEPRTLGEHVRKRRLILGITQKEAARLIGVNQFTIMTWEKDRTEPPVRAMPGLIRYLGYDPFPPAETIPERLRAKRRQNGWSRNMAAAKLGIDESTLRDWEAGEMILYRSHRALISQWLGLPVMEIDHEMATRWGRLHQVVEA